MRTECQRQVPGMIQFLITFLFLFLTLSCEKSVFDYRHKYIGEWDFITIGCYWSMSPYPTGWFLRDTIYFHGEISYGDGKGELVIQYKSDENVLISINKDGTIDGSYEVSGQFDDKEHLTLTLNSPQSQLGGGYNKSIVGWK